MCVDFGICHEAFGSFGGKYAFSLVFLVNLGKDSATQLDNTRSQMGKTKSKYIPPPRFVTLFLFCFARCDMYIVRGLCVVFLD